MTVEHEHEGQWYVCDPYPTVYRWCTVCGELESGYGRDYVDLDYADGRLASKERMASHQSDEVLAELMEALR